jgi:mRNA interferase RelE/StbE
VAEYSLTIKSSARKELEALDDTLFTRIESKILRLADNPRPPGCTKLKGYSDIWRIRIGDYRVLYTIDDKEFAVRISRIAHRREVYDL